MQNINFNEICSNEIHLTVIQLVYINHMFFNDELLE